jgi:SAM-dependent methyltransferase
VLNPTDQLDDWLVDNLVCPADSQSVLYDGQRLVCNAGHTYRVLKGIPIMLLEDIDPTHSVFRESVAIAKAKDEDLPGLIKYHPPVNGIDQYVQGMIAATNGNLYNHLRFNLKSYPIPELRLPRSEGKVFLELGCNWGRWCLSASKQGFLAVGIDPSFHGVWAAQRVAKELGVRALYIVADARRLPFREGSIDVVFSYSVLQHFAKDNVTKALIQIARVLKDHGQCVIQLPNKYGLVNLLRQMQRGAKEGKDFEVRYWSPSEILAAFSKCVGPAELTVDGFFSLNAQTSDRNLLTPSGRVIVSCSDALRKLEGYFHPLMNLADSLYVKAFK